MPGEYAKVLIMPRCDPCWVLHEVERDAAYDGKTQSGPWAYMCEEHFMNRGMGAGLGRGQRLVLTGKESGDGQARDSVERGQAVQGMHEVRCQSARTGPGEARMRLLEQFYYYFFEDFTVLWGLVLLLGLAFVGLVVFLAVVMPVLLLMEVGG